MARRRNRQAPAPTKALPANQFASCIRNLQGKSSEKVEGVRLVAEETLKRCGCECDKKCAIQDCPKGGSNQVDFGSIITWMNNIKKGDGDALEQVKAIQATAATR